MPATSLWFVETTSVVETVIQVVVGVMATAKDNFAPET